MKAKETRICVECDEAFYAGNRSCTNCGNEQALYLNTILASAQKSTELLSQLTKAVKDRLITVTNTKLNAIVDEAAQHLKKGGW